MNHDRIRPPGHREICELVPWHVNGTIGAVDRQRLDAHLLSCTACRNEMRQERSIYQSMQPDSSLEYMPAASLRRLQSRLDDGEIEPDQRTLPRQRLAAVSIAVVTVALSLISADTWRRLQAPELSPDYHTVTTSGPRAPNEVIRAVFSPATKLIELQIILDEAELRIIAGPSEAGVYSLASTSKRPVISSLALLRRHPAVRFAETTQPADPRESADFR